MGLLPQTDFRLFSSKGLGFLALERFWLRLPRHGAFSIVTYSWAHLPSKHFVKCRNNRSLDLSLIIPLQTGTSKLLPRPSGALQALIATEMASEWLLRVSPELPDAWGVTKALQNQMFEAWKNECRLAFYETSPVFDLNILQSWCSVVRCSLAQDFRLSLRGRYHHLE